MSCCAGGARLARLVRAPQSRGRSCNPRRPAPSSERNWHDHDSAKTPERRRHREQRPTGADADGTDGGDADGTDGGDADGTDGGDDATAPTVTTATPTAPTPETPADAHSTCSAVTPRPSARRSGRPACTCTTTDPATLVGLLSLEDADRLLTVDRDPHARRPAGPGRRGAAGVARTPAAATLAGQPLTGLVDARKVARRCSTTARPSSSRGCTATGRR